MKKNSEETNKINEELKNDKSSADEKSEESCDEIKSQLLRVNADFQNFKRRVEKEKSEWMDFSQIAIIESFLPFIDDVERALETSKKQEVGKEDLAWIQGFELIYKNLQKTFKDLKIEEIDCSKDFNPDFHEALMQVESDDHESGQIVQVFNKGYNFKGKVIRHAKVSVAK